MKRYIAFSILALLPALAACRAPSYHSKAPVPAPFAGRLPIKAVVWVFNDQTSPSPDSLTKTDSAWRPPLPMEFLSSALASELQARVVESAEVEQNPANQLMLEAHGTQLFLEGTVQEASWTRSASGGTYRLKIALSATFAPKQGPVLQDFWTKTLEVEEPQRLLPADDMAPVLAKAFSGAVADLAETLAKQPAAGESTQ